VRSLEEKEEMMAADCKFCGTRMEAMCYPKYTQSDTINDWCRKCNAHRYGKRDGDIKWYSGKEWFAWVNSKPLEELV
jgi:transcription elongation factor Elf1